MIFSKKKLLQSDSVAATDLALLSVCETQVLRKHMGVKIAPIERGQQRAIKGGVREHARHHAKVEAMHADKRCFIATAVYGEDHPNTEYLRRFRDQVLLASKLGSIAVGIYYRLSPAVANQLSRFNFLLSPSKYLLDVLVKALRKAGVVNE
tara:strand:+ start:209 stop:661 length:453 start_codon:yes stop_codon:yes gene_type:complete